MVGKVRTLLVSSLLISSDADLMTCCTQATKNEGKVVQGEIKQTEGKAGLANAGMAGAPGTVGTTGTTHTTTTGGAY